jgi:hypothetical protein
MGRSDEVDALTPGGGKIHFVGKSSNDAMIEEIGRETNVKKACRSWVDASTGELVCSDDTADVSMPMALPEMRRNSDLDLVSAVT